MNNIFAECESVDDFLKMLRRDVERLRGKKFRMWEVTRPWVNHENLHFSIAATYTEYRVDANRAYGITWYEIAEGEHNLEEARHVPLRAHAGKGYGVFKSSGGHSFGANGFKVYTSIPLKRLPKVQRAVRAAAQIEAKRKKLEDDPVLVRMLMQQKELADRVAALRVKLNEQFDEKHKKKLQDIKKRVVVPTLVLGT